MKYFLIILLFSSLNLFSQQQPDLDFPINIENPQYNGDETALIGIDASHNNMHTLKTNFVPFAKLMEADGYQPISIEEITEEALDSINIFVIANALNSSNIRNWRRPIANAFTKSEIKIIEKWVKDGGSLLVIADHMPFAGATNELAKKFGFTYEDGFVMKEGESWPPDTYSKKAGNLFDTPITKNIDSLAAFTGSALIPPEDAIIIAKFPQTHKLLIPEIAWQFEENTIEKSIENVVMGAIKNHGNGKVAFFTEAAMFTAQIVQEKHKVGFNSPAAPQNIQFVLNTIHWLDNGRLINREDYQTEE
ncbi:hypothetical protein QYS49_39105 [Marivirga salinae]|uniref:DUF4350 domain-containing protein n=1 Tax=Marivirga salinarum TaxID=3059078 RepID=A0AA51RAY4_9BACT|nr:hypothetical protein [Marivirga sp. BDSF4-3]WMN11641.1 hypothetical protein QYS49_39105 [Marivirga sp. BDSF4-3]